MGKIKKIKDLVRDRMNLIRGNLSDKDIFLTSAAREYFVNAAKAALNRYGSDFGITVKVIYDESESAPIAYTTFSEIVLNAGCEQVRKLKTYQEKFLYLIGLLAHEIGHILYMDSIYIERYFKSLASGRMIPCIPSGPNRDKISETIKNPASAIKLIGIVKEMINIIEDGFDENTYPYNNYGPLVEGMEYMRGEFFKDLKDIEAIEKEYDNGNPLGAVFSLMLSWSLYHEIKGANDSYDVMYELDRSMFIINRTLVENHQKERINSVNELVSMFWDYIEPIVKSDNNQQQNQDNQQNNQGNGNGQSQPQQNGGQSGQSQQQMNNGQSSESQGDGQNQSNEQQSNGQQSGNSEDSGKEGNSDKKGGSSKSKKNNGGEGGKEKNQEESGKEKNPSNNGEKGKDEGPKREQKPENFETNPSNKPESGDRKSHNITLPQQNADPNNINGSKPEVVINDNINEINEMIENAVKEIATKQLEEENAQNMQLEANEGSYKGCKIIISRPTVVNDTMKCYYEQFSEILATSKRMQKKLLQHVKDMREGGKRTNLYLGRHVELRSFIREDGRNFYNNKLPQEEPRICIYVVIDESGSMSKMCKNNKTRIENAKETAIILEDFCRALDFPIEIIGSTADHRASNAAELTVYSSFTSFDKNDKYRLTAITDKSCCRDGAAISYALDKLKKRNEDVKILFVISDGQPNAINYGGKTAINELKQLKEEIDKNKIVMFAAAVGEDKDKIERIYGESFLDISNMEEMPNIFISKIKKFIKK